MARLRVPAVALRIVLVLGAALAGFVAYVFAGGHVVGIYWAVMVFLAVLVAWLVFSVARSDSERTAERRSDEDLD